MSRPTPPTATTPAVPVSAPRIGAWVALTVAAWHLAFFGTGAVTLALASSPAGSVFEGLAEPVHQRLLAAAHLRVLAGYAIVAVAALALAYPLVRLWTGTGRVTRWGVVARTLVVLAGLMGHGWLRLAHSQPYFLGPATYDTWYFRLIESWPLETRERLLFVAFTFVPAVVGVAAAGVYVVEAARWFREGGRGVRIGIGAIGTTLLLAVGWWLAPHFTHRGGSGASERMNVLMLSTDQIPAAAPVTAEPAENPHLARLAADSIVLTNMHSPLPTAVGEAATLMTGQAPHTHRLQTPFPSRAAVTDALAAAPRLPAILSSQGYATALVGDDGAGGLATAEGLGFGDVLAGVPGSYPRHVAGIAYPAHFIIPAWLDNRLGRRLLPDLAVLPGSVSGSLVADRLKERLEQGADEGKPFFLHGVFSQGAPSPPPARGLASDPPAGDFDRQLGRVLEALDRHGLRESTILLVLGPSPEARSKGENNPGSALSVILHVPGHRLPHRQFEQTTRLQDLAPTLLDLLGLPRDPAMDGVSLRPALEDPSVSLELAAFGESGGFPDVPPAPSAPADSRLAFLAGVRLDADSGHRIVLKDELAAHHRKIRWVRTAHWQLVFTPAATASEATDQWELFDLRSDPGTTRDVKLQNPQVWQSLELALRRWADHRQESRIDQIFPDGEPAAVILPGT